MVAMIHRLVGVAVLGVLTAGCGSGPAHRRGGGPGPGQPESSAAFGGCFESDPTNIYRTAAMCLGPPEQPPGRFWLETMEAVPDATFRNRCEGTYQMGSGSVVLNVQQCSNQTTNEQLGQGQTTQSGASSQRHATLRSSNEIWLTLSPGSDVQLLRKR
jgi:hypothetical protein